MTELRLSDKRKSGLWSTNISYGGEGLLLVNALNLFVSVYIDSILRDSVSFLNDPRQ